MWKSGRHPICGRWD